MIDLQDVSFRYGDPDLAEPGAKLPLALDGVSLNVAAGEVVVLAGASGCGKTTVTRLVNGLLAGRGVATGKIRVSGLDPASTPTALLARRVGSVFQDPRTQFFTTDVASELAFGCENLAVPPGQAAERVAQVTADWDLAGLLDRSVFALSGGQKQRVVCAAVEALSPSVLVLDEPSANLDPPSTARLAEFIARWKAQGKAILVAEHRLAYLAAAADRFIILKAGRVTHRLTASEARALAPQAFADLGLRPLESGQHPSWATDQSPLSPPPVDPASDRIELRDVAYWRPHRGRRKRARQVLGIDRLDFLKGETVALTGANGSGKTTLLRWLAGVAGGGRGQLRVDGEVWRARQRLGRVALVGQEVSRQLFADTVQGELRLAERRLPADSVQAILDRLDLGHLVDRHPLTLSSGERQRLAIAAALAQERPIVALDEPTSGLDLAHMSQVASGIKELAASGRTVLVATHDRDLLAACAQRVVKLDQGRA
jgi:energy-coupling factor transport system ATP-binding protein